MIDPQEGDIGRRVIYRPFWNPSDFETGVITGWNDSWIFVRYGNDVNAKATSWLDLEWEGEPQSGGVSG